MSDVFGATILGVDGLHLSPEETAFFRDVNPFGFILFARNIDTPDQVRGLCGALREAVGRNAPITIDQEGGRVQRLGPPHWRQWAPPLDMVAQAGAHARRAMFLRARIMADELNRLGIDSNCAPLADVASDKTHPFLRNRCYGTDPAEVSALAQAVAEGLLEGGVLPVLKHIPGHGAATTDSHFDLPHVTDALADLEAKDFAPFEALKSLPMAMTAHIVYPAIDTDPATLSPKVLSVIREKIGFDGLIMTDDIDMKALSGSLTERSRAALAAGCDVVLHCNGSLAERAEVAAAAGEMRPAAQRRAEAALATRKRPEPVDIPALEAELEALLDGQGHG